MATNKKTHERLQYNDIVSMIEPRNAALFFYLDLSITEKLLCE